MCSCCLLVCWLLWGCCLLHVVLVDGSYGYCFKRYGENGNGNEKKKTTINEKMNVCVWIGNNDGNHSFKPHMDVDVGGVCLKRVDVCVCVC
eukprot:UN01948